MLVSLRKKPVMSVHRDILKATKLVYLLVGPKPIKYKDGRSRIIYIGTTGKGASRIAKSATFRAEDAFAQRGFKHLDVYVVTCSPRKGMKSWTVLEKALLACFRDLYHELPLCNEEGKKLKWSEEYSKLFRRNRLEAILKRFGP